MATPAFPPANALSAQREGFSTWRETLSVLPERTSVSPLAVATTPETREYRAVGVLNDEEIGQTSDIVSVVYGG